MPPDGEGAPAKGAEGDKGDKGDQIDVEAAKAALKTVADMKEAGLDDPAGALDTIRKLRDFEQGKKLPKQVQKELDDLKAKVAEADKGKLSAEEQTAKELAELKEQLASAEVKGRTRAAKAALTAEGAKANALYPDDIARLVEPDQLEFDDDGNLTNAKALVAALKKDRPGLFNARAGSFDGGARKTAPGPTDMNDRIRRAAGRT